MVNGVGVLVDLTKCIGCRACQVACKRWHELPAEKTGFSPDWTNPPSLSRDTWTRIRFVELDVDGEFVWRFVKEQCMHCIDAPCVNVCPSKALYIAGRGYVLYDEEHCIGCRYCIQACPFDVPKFDWEKNRVVQKCTFCFERIEIGLKPVCVESCPADALEFYHEYSDLVNRVEEIKARRGGNIYVYGLDEVGGLRWVYISDIPFEDLGFPRYSPERYSTAVLRQLGEFGLIGIGAGIIGLLLQKYSRRREELSKGKEGD